MFGSLSLLPSLAVAGVTTSVSLATAMGGVQSLPQAPDRPPIVRTAAAPVEASAVMGATALRIEQPVDEPDVVAPAPDPTAAPSSAPTVATVVPAPATVSRPATIAAPAPKPTSAPTAAPAPASQCTTWLYQGWTVTWCAPAIAGGIATWSVTNGTTTYSGTYNMTTGAYTGTYPSGWSSNWGTSGGKHGHK